MKDYGGEEIGSTAKEVRPTIGWYGRPLDQVTM
jgi:hypothetical protein